MPRLRGSQGGRQGLSSRCSPHSQFIGTASSSCVRPLWTLQQPRPEAWRPSPWAWWSCHWYLHGLQLWLRHTSPGTSARLFTAIAGWGSEAHVSAVRLRAPAHSLLLACPTPPLTTSVCSPGRAATGGGCPLSLRSWVPSRVSSCVPAHDRLPPGAAPTLSTDEENGEVVPHEAQEQM